jgi:hypothetical protein
MRRFAAKASRNGLRKNAEPLPVYGEGDKENYFRENSLLYGRCSLLSQTLSGGNRTFLDKEW